MQIPIEKIVDEFYANGFALVPGVLTQEQIRKLRAIADRHLDDPAHAPAGAVENVYDTPVLRNTQSLDPIFCNLLGQEPFVALAEAVLGPDVGFCGQNVIRSGKGQAISKWHVDDLLEFPLPPQVPRHDARIRMPVTWFSFQIALSDIDSPEDGATEVVPGSHYSGRVPPQDRVDADEHNPPSFEGAAAQSILCKAGDVYLFNHQLWHRGRPNRSGRVRYLMQNQYSRSWAARRFGPGPHRDCDLPAEVLSKVSDKARRILRIE